VPHKQSLLFVWLAETALDDGSDRLRSDRADAAPLLFGQRLAHGLRHEIWNDHPDDMDAAHDQCDRCLKLTGSA